MSVSGAILFIVIFLMAFWLLVFLMGIAIPYWVTMGALQMVKPKKVFEQDEE